MRRLPSTFKSNTIWRLRCRSPVKQQASSLTQRIWVSVKPLPLAREGAREIGPEGEGVVLGLSTLLAARTSPTGRRVNTSVLNLVIPRMRGSAAASISLTFPRKSHAGSIRNGSGTSFAIPKGGLSMQKELLPVDTITRWAIILPELWQFLYSEAGVPGDRNQVRRHAARSTSHIGEYQREYQLGVAFLSGANPKSS